MQRKMKKNNVKSKATIKMINTKMIGNEIKFKNKKLTNMDCIKAFNWYNYSLDISHSKDFTFKFLTDNNLNDLAKESKNINDAMFPKTSGWVFRLISLGYELDSEMIKRSILNIKNEIEKQKIKNQNKPEVINTNISNKNKNSLIADIEDVLDQHLKNEISEFNLYNKLVVEKVSLVNAKEAIEYYQPIFDEMLNALKPKADVQLVEGYNVKKNKQFLLKRLEFIKKLIDDLNRFSNNKKIVKNPRVKKPLTMEKKLKAFQYQKQSPELKLISQNPEKTIESSEVYLYNTKSTILTKLVAKENQKLDIMGNKFINWDEEKSSAKRLGKKAERTLQNLISKAKNSFKKEYEDIKCSSYNVSPRSNEYSIILKVL